MPEGDSIFRAAKRLRPVIVDHALTNALASKSEIPVARLIGRKATSIETFGKNLYVVFEPLGAIHVHLGMDGRISVLSRAPLFPPRAPVHALVLSVGRKHVFVRAPKVLEFVSPGDIPGTTAAPSVDLLKEFDRDAVISGLKKLGPLPIGSALMRQAVVAGIGNVYKSEVLFRTRTDPNVPVSALSETKLREIVEQAALLLRRNVSIYSTARRTNFGAGPRYSVYERGGEPCLVCGAKIVRTVDREGARSTYACPRCQKKP